MQNLFVKQPFLLTFILHTSKTHGPGDKPQVIKITGPDSPYVRYGADTKNHGICPFQMISTYLQIRKKRDDINEQFFTFSNRSPITAANLHSVLHKSLTIAGLDTNMYGSHGFHAGHAVDMLTILNLDICAIRKIGRWRSNAVFKYLAI